MHSFGDEGEQNANQESNRGFERDQPSTQSQSKTPRMASGRFAPGESLTDRYRIVQLLGEGGMGEVYRADDLAIEQPVALKFLRPELARDPILIERLRAEVRLARRVTHANVCRVHDLGEFDGQPFISMEFVDGEDLSSLLRRAGKLTSERALGIARQICAGLAAAHSSGVLHRDLKPANVLIDSEGQVKLSDFGLALGSEEDASSLAGSGTPGYMAPEQMSGAPASAATDIYSLGVLLWELFTGTQLFSTTGAKELQRAQSKAIRPLSEVVRDVDRELESEIMRCLSKNPANRPQSAVSVLAAFPGIDLLSAAMAAGEPPSPELVATVGKQGALSTRAARILGVLGIALLALVAWLDSQVSLANRSELPLEPAVLRHRAQSILRESGHPDDAVDSADGFSRMGTNLRWISHQGKGQERWDRLKEKGPPGLIYWYRESPHRLEPENTAGWVKLDDPSIQTEGQRTVWLSPRGELLLMAVELAKLPKPDAERELDWQGLLSDVGVEGELDASEDALFVPPFASDQLVHWKGVYPGTEDLQIDIVGASLRSVPVFLQVLVPGQGIFGRSPRNLSPTELTNANAPSFFFEFTVLIAGALLARRHWLRGWGDRKGGLRLFGAVLAMSIMSWVFGAHHTSNAIAEFRGFLHFLSGALFRSTLVWMTYLALEPIVRRRWPTRLVSWSRLVSGRWRDPLVGRCLMTAVIVALLVHLVSVLQVGIGWQYGEGSQLPLNGDERILSGAREALAILLNTGVESIIPALGFIVLLIVLRVVLRFEHLAALFVVMLGILLKSNRETAGLLPLDLSVTIAHGALLYFLILRQELLTLVVSIACILVMMNFPLLPNPDNWYTASSGVAFAFIGGLLLLGWRLATPKKS